MKDLISSIASVDYAKRFGGAADVAKNVGSTVADYAVRGGSSAADLAKRGGSSAADLAMVAGSGAVDLAKKIGPKRAMIGLAAIGAAVGGYYLVRYLLSAPDEDADLEAGEEPATAEGKRQRKQTRAKRKAANAMTH